MTGVANRYAGETAGTNLLLRLLAPMKGLPTEYLKRADEYRRLAADAHDPVIAACLVEVAEQYEAAIQGLVPPESSPTAQ